MRTKLKIALLIVSALAAARSSFDASALGNPQAVKQEAGQAASPQKRLDPAAWGGNHAGKPVPEYIHGDECLFCHRNDIGPGWQKNSHGVTVRQREDAPELQGLVKSQGALSALAPQIEYFLGSRHRVRFLKKEGYGKFALLGTQAEVGADRRAQKWIDLEKPYWDKDRFASRCAGCHATGVDAQTKAFSAFGIDCYACHGVVDLGHTADTSLVFLSKKRRADARAITSACAQCHVRTGKSRSTGLPYPNNFVAGDNLFQDFEVDFSRADDDGLNAGDRHVMRNVRDVAVYGSEFPTCISCHDVHKQSSLKHRRAPRTAICADCHDREGPIKGTKPFAVHSSLCEY
ncbi:MAG TPA: multiheme c-type cytochrome [Blastocatellia bacterium]|nr:multiheme c-type cytochrome [Blastocatellia bacterium]